ncbi:hypothetical protein EJ02DRAFT_423671 [Clathrospora elynae]|uniref:Uncharacterized protein n=1 Tax=Clathrospora elynae TaxID=706981 RepID=A0A6A5SQF8_9PLEO|nr:hypothetical protein EJ02DRAFT_423671 [Clathrospora elynae]
MQSGRRHKLYDTLPIAFFNPPLSEESSAYLGYPYFAPLSPKFFLLPREIRDKIYDLALGSFQIIFEHEGAVWITISNAVVDCNVAGTYPYYSIHFNTHRDHSRALKKIFAKDTSLRDLAVQIQVDSNPAFEVEGEDFHPSLRFLRVLLCSMLSRLRIVVDVDLDTHLSF